VAELIRQSWLWIRLWPRLRPGWRPCFEAIKQQTAARWDDAAAPRAAGWPEWPPRRSSTSVVRQSRRAAVCPADRVGLPLNQAEALGTPVCREVSSRCLSRKPLRAHSPHLPKAKLSVGGWCHQAAVHVDHREVVVLGPSWRPGACGESCQAGRMRLKLDAGPLRDGVGGAEQASPGASAQRSGGTEQGVGDQVRARFLAVHQSECQLAAAVEPWPPRVEALEHAQQLIKVTPPELAGGWRMTAMAAQSADQRSHRPGRRYKRLEVGGSDQARLASPHQGPPLVASPPGVETLFPSRADRQTGGGQQGLGACRSPGA